MADLSIISNARFIYVHDNTNIPPPHAVDTHHIIVRRSAVKPVVTYLIAILLVAYSVFLHFEKGKPVTTVIWSFFIGAILVKLLIWRPIVKVGLCVVVEVTTKIHPIILRQMVLTGLILHPLLFAPPFA